MKTKFPSRFVVFALFSMLAVPLSHADQSPCADPAEGLRMQDTVKTYYQVAHGNDAKTANDVYQTIQSQIARNTSCRDALMEQYLVSSLSEGAAFFTDKRVDGRINSPDLLVAVSHLVEGLYAKGHVVFLTEDFRRSHGRRWTELDSDQQYTGIGGYDCAGAVLYIDPTLHPVDLALTAFHELDHFVRDKTAPAFTRSSDGTPVNWAAYNLSDEFSAVTYSAAVQGDLQRNYVSGPIHRTPFRVKGDLSLFKVDGEYGHLFGLNGNHCNVGMWVVTTIGDPLGGECFAEPGHHVNDLTFADSIYSGKLEFGEKSKAKKLSEIRGQILGKLWNAYFAGDEKDFPSVMESSVKQGKSLVQYVEGGGSLDALVATADGASAVCQAYRDDLAKSDVSTYLGVDFPVTDQQARGTIHPCLRSRTGL